ncbi:LamB/YcsF family protein [Corynebacterium kutscheri]|uniref:5-oxoprolinase subunit A n=1 Tax=Corynebacterium kutscheri TaxID=35755 RepID=A0AB38VZY8_9CORY|nr:5-oxoprolinase subunit PxpA [Corynebacterium kutscheri]VEH09038.1 LamB/YcsF family protein [Corynebacterium kutscheri]
MSLHIDLNADLGESFGHYTIGSDKRMLELVSSANIACGFHAGDPLVALHTTAQAAKYNVRIGAHPGYRDLAGFGRRAMNYDQETLRAEIIYQIGALQAAAQAAHARVEYVKPHGALYNTIAHDEYQAHAVIEAILAVDPTLKLMALAGSPIVHWARTAGLSVIQEAFADRAYTDQATLVPRSQPGSVHHDPNIAAAQALAFARNEEITTITGKKITIEADSICVHGDNEAALTLVQHIITTLDHHDITIRP